MNKPADLNLKVREEFIQTLAERLSSKEAYLAAWLSGSYARGEQDVLSDIDITLVVADENSKTLCARPLLVSAQTTPERYDVFRLFGQPAMIHENNNNAPAAGTFTFVAYERDATLVDWVLRPLTGAERPAGSRVLFDKVGLPIQPPAEIESREQRAGEASEIMAFFWMMSTVTVKYIFRGDGVFVNTWLEELTRLVFEVERRIAGQAWQYKRGSLTHLKVTPEEQIDALCQLCAKMENLMPEVSRLGGQVHESAMVVVEKLLGITQEKES